MVRVRIRVRVMVSLVVCGTVRVLELCGVRAFEELGKPRVRVRVRHCFSLDDSYPSLAPSMGRSMVV